MSGASCVPGWQLVQDDVGYAYAVTEAAAGTAQALQRPAQRRSSLLVARHRRELPSDTRGFSQALLVVCVGG
jgi:hypothetical protein